MTFRHSSKTTSLDSHPCLPMEARCKPTPICGRVIVCLKPNANETISSTLKSQIESYLKTKCPVSIQPSVVEPDLIYVRADTSVRFNENQTPLTETTMASLCKDLIRNYLVDNTRDFVTTVTELCCRKVYYRYRLINYFCIPSSST